MPLRFTSSFTCEALRSISCEADAAGTMARAAARTRTTRRTRRFLGAHGPRGHHSKELGLVLAELLREQAARERPPGQLRVGGERDERLRDAREAGRLAGQARDPRRELGAPLGRVELRRER